MSRDLGGEKKKRKWRIEEKEAGEEAIVILEEITNTTKEMRFEEKGSISLRMSRIDRIQ